MSGGLVSFGDYIFSNLGRYNSNFANQQSQVTRLAGMDGGFDHYGDDPAPAPVGRVTQSFRLIAATREEMDAKRDAVRLMQNYGTAKLYYQPSEPTDVVRWTWARMLLPTMSENKSGNTDLWQPVSVTFECPEPVWWVNTYVGWTWGDGWQWGDPGHIWGGGGFEINGFDETDAVLPNNGNAITIPHITIQPQDGQSCANPIIQRLEGGSPVETFSYEGRLNAGEVLDINGRSQSVTVDGQPVFDDIGYETAAFFHLPPGDNDVRILLEDVSTPGANSYRAVNHDVEPAEDGIGTYNGFSSYTDIYSPAFAAWFDGAEGTVIQLSKMVDGGWDDADIKSGVVMYADASNHFRMLKAGVANVFQIGRTASGVNIILNLVGTSIDWDTWGMTWSESAGATGEWLAFQTGVKQGATRVGIGAWAGGPLAADSVAIGSRWSAPDRLWDGDLGDTIVAKSVATPAQMATLHSKLIARTLTSADLDTIFGAGDWVWWRPDTIIGTAYDAGDNGLDGAYTDVIVGDGTGAYNGTTAYLDAFSSALATFFDEAQGSIILKSIADVGVLADGIRRDLFQFGVDGNNYIGMSKTVGGLFNAEHVAGGTSTTQTLSYSEDTAQVAAQTWDVGEDKFKAYLGGVQAGSTGTGLGTWAGALLTGYIGAFSSAANFWKGGISDVIFSNLVADDTQMATINSKLAAGTLTVIDLNTIFGVGNWAWWGMNESTQAARTTFFYRDSYR